MGLAAVPFGTAQAEIVTIRVVKEELMQEKGARFVISKENEKGECLESVSILWRDKDKYPVPILQPKGWLRIYDDADSISEWRSDKGKYSHVSYGVRANLVHSTLSDTFLNMEKWAEFYGKNKFPDEFISKVAPQFVFSDLKDDTDGKFSVTIPHERVCDFLKGDKSKKGKIIEEYKKIKEETYATIRERLKNALRQRTICGCGVFKNRPFVVETSFFVDYNLPKECTCVHYSGFDGFHFFLVRDLKRKINHAMYNLVVYAPFKHDTFCLLSDIPTVSRCYRAVYTDHEISKIDRQRMGNLIRFDCLRANFGKRPYVWEIFSH